MTERNLIPEGTAFDTRNGTIYIGSTFKRKIVQITKDGIVSDFISEKFEGIASLVGMEVDEERGILWANIAHAHEVMPLMNPDTTRDWMTEVACFDIQNRQLIKRYTLNAEQAFFNDLTVLPGGDVFATESVHNRIYRIGAQTDSLEMFLEPEGYSFLNGITYAAKTNTLFVSSTQGILKVDLLNKRYELLISADSIDATRIDGLTFWSEGLIGHQSSRVSVFYLNESQTWIDRLELLDSDDEFDSSTTGEVGDGYYYFIVNSQIRSGIDRDKGTIKPQDSLNDIIIRKIKL